MTEYIKDISSTVGLSSTVIKASSTIFNSILGLYSTSDSVKTLSRLFLTLLGLSSSGIRSYFKVLAVLLGSALTIGKTLSIQKILSIAVSLLGSHGRLLSIKKDFLLSLGKALLPSATTSTQGIPAGSRLYYSVGGSPEVWVKEVARTKIKLTDAIAGRSRIVLITLANPKNNKDSIYTIFKRIKISDHTTNQIIFLGRVTMSNSGWDPELGLVLNVSAQDYMYELTTRYCTTNFTIPIPKSVMVSQIVSNNSTSGSLGLNIELGLPIENITRNYSTSNKKCTEAIEEIAVDDGIYSSGQGSILTPGFTIRIINPPGDATGWIFNLGPISLDPAIEPFLPASTIALGDTFFFNTNVPDGARMTITVGGGAVTIQTYDLPVSNYKEYIYDCDKEYFSGIYTIGCDYRVSDDQVFEYFPRGSRPIGGTSEGLTISLTDTPGDQVKRMLSDYNFSSSPKDIITHIICRGQDADGNKLEATAVNTTLEAQYGIRTEHIDTVYGTTTQVFLNTRANSLLTVFGKTIKRGACKIVGYPIYKVDGLYHTVRAGDVIHINNTLQNVDQDYLVVTIEYEEPPFITKFELLDISNYGRELPLGLEGSLSAADIGDLRQKTNLPTKHTICFYIPDDLVVTV